MTYLLEIINRAALRPNGNLFFFFAFFFAISFIAIKILVKAALQFLHHFLLCELNPKSFKLTSQTLLGSR